MSDTAPETTGPLPVRDPGATLRHPPATTLRPTLDWADPDNRPAARAAFGEPNETSEQ